MVRDPDSGKYRRQVPADTALRPDPGLLAQGRAAAGPAVRARRSGPNCTSGRSDGWEAPCASSCSTTSRRASSPRTSTIPCSIRSTATCWPTTGSSPCRVASATPIARGKVEAAVGHAQKTPLRGRRFERLDDGQAYLDRWEQRWADTRIHGTTKRQVAAMFAEERPALGPLPLEPFRYYQYGRRNVHLDGCVEVAAAYYSARRPAGSAAPSMCSGTGVRASGRKPNGRPTSSTLARGGTFRPVSPVLCRRGRTP